MIKLKQTMFLKDIFVKKGSKKTCFQVDDCDIREGLDTKLYGMFDDVTCIGFRFQNTTWRRKVI